MLRVLWKDKIVDKDQKGYRLTARGYNLEMEVIRKSIS